MNTSHGHHIPATEFVPADAVARCGGIGLCSVCSNEAMQVNVQKSLETSSFAAELAEIINKHSKENASNTQDFVLASYLIDCLNAYNRAVNDRDKLKE